MTSEVATAPAVPPSGHDLSDVLLDLSHLSRLYRVRAATRAPVPLHDWSPAERAVRREVARVVLERQLPALVAELIAAATDDLTAEAPTDTEAVAGGELRVVEAVE